MEPLPPRFNPLFIRGFFVWAVKSGKREKNEKVSIPYSSGVSLYTLTIISRDGDKTVSIPYSSGVSLYSQTKEEYHTIQTTFQSLIHQGFLCIIGHEIF